MTSHTLAADETWLACLGVKDDSLMTAVLTRDMAAAATDALLMVDLGIDDGIPVEVGGVLEIGQLLTHKVFQMLYAAFCHVSLHAQHQVIYNAIAILHDGCTDLHVAATKLDKLQSVSPGLDSSDTTVLYFFS